MDFALSFLANCIANVTNLFTTLFNGIPGSHAVWLASITIFLAGRFLLLPIAGGIITGVRSDTARRVQGNQSKGKKGS